MRFSRAIGMALAVGAAPPDAHAQSLVQQIPPQARQYAVSYEVRLSFTGYTGLIESPQCPVSRTGTDSLSGTLTGLEIPGDSGDVIYTGVLKRTTQIDFCLDRPGPTRDQLKLCGVTLTGNAMMEVELTVYLDSARGAYMKTAQAAGPSSAQVGGGSCDPQQLQAVRADYPAGSGGGGASPDGQPIDDTKAVDLNNRPIRFFARGVARLRPGTYPPDNPQGGGWKLQVIRRIP